MEMGTGKSKVLLDNIAMLYDKGAINSALIVAPKSVYRNWEKLEIPIHLPDHIEPFIGVWQATTTKTQQEIIENCLTPQERLKIVLMNVEALSTKKGAMFADKFLKCNKVLLAIDESTTIKNHKAKRTKTVLALREHAKCRRILTGMPITKNPMDLFTQCNFLDPDLLGYSSFYAFQGRYANTIRRKGAGGFHEYNHVIGYRNLDELEKTLKKFSYRVLKQDCLDLPDKIYTTRVIQLTEQQKKLYLQMKRFALAELKGRTMTSFNILTQIMRLHQIICGFMKTDEGRIIDVENTRVQELLSVLDETEGKAIIWCTYRHNILSLKDILREKYGELSTDTLFGDTPDKKRMTLIERFQDKKSPLRFLIGNPQTGGRGITLTAANTVIYYSNGYDLEIRLQSEDRAHRIGQTNKVLYVDIVAEKTVDEKIIKALKSKINIAKEIMGEELKSWI
jgi:SNF2 family DNA or RNA helicase